jgi:hypothetical protein
MSCGNAPSTWAIDAAISASNGEMCSLDCTASMNPVVCISSLNLATMVLRMVSASTPGLNS